MVPRGRGLVLGLLLLLPFALAAQQLPFAHLSISDGLEDTVIFAMEQDQSGYLWIATRTGLNRFDGAQFWTYTQADGLPHNLARDLLLDRDGTLWAATERGVAWFDGQRFNTLGPDHGWPGKTSARALSLAADGTLWVASYGAGVLQLAVGPEPKVLAQFGLSEGLPTERVRSLMVDKDGLVWLGTSNDAVWRIDDGSVSAVAWNLPSSEVRALYQHGDGSIWAGTRTGVARWTGNDFEFLFPGSHLSEQTINFIAQDNQGRIWFGTREGGAFSLGGDGVLEQLDSGNGLPDDSVNVIYEDNEGNLWFGTYGGGVARLSTSSVLNWKAQAEFPNPNVYAIADDLNGCIWFGTNGNGVTSLCDGQMRNYTRADGLPHNKVLSAMVDQHGDPWFGTLEGISRFHDGQFTNYGEADGLAAMVSYHVLSARDGSIWIGTIDGLAHFKDQQFSAYDESVGLPDNRVNRLLERDNGDLWLATANGLALFRDEAFATWSTEQGLPSNFINDLYEDEQGGLWIATNNGLSYLFEGALQNWTRADGLPHNNCTVILPGNSGEIWIGTSRGVAIFDRTSFTVVTSREGLVFDLINRGGGYRDPEGNLWFGTGAGVSRFAADFRPGATNSPPVQLLSVASSRGDLPLDEPARIDQQDNILQFSYAAISFQRAPDVVYRYRLARDSDTPWRQTRLRELQINSLAPGDYRFEVSARIGEGAWNPNPAAFGFTVVPPFWRTPLFLFLLLASVIGALLYRNHLSQRRALFLETTVRERTQQLEELNEGLEWLANHDNLTHLANRNQVHHRLTSLHDRQPDVQLGIVVIDLDHFKTVNDQYGHAGGDQALEVFARMLHGHVRTDQFAARWGGEEFLVVCPGIDHERLQALAGQLLEHCRNLDVRIAPGRSLELRCSLGFAMTPPGSKDLPWEKVFQLADLALLEAKRNGRDRAEGYFWNKPIEAPWDLDRILSERDQAIEQGFLKQVTVS
jgi:diguanylate cyclase (GGDEF)-like protein